MAASPTFSYLDLSCNICNISLNRYNICNSECHHQFCSNCFFKIIRNSNKCPLCEYNFSSLNHDKIKEDLWNTFPTYLTQWSTFIRLKNLNDKLSKNNEELLKEYHKQKKQLIHIREAVDYNSGYYYGSLKTYKLTRKGQFYINNYSNSHWVRGYKDACFDITIQNEKNKPNENVKYEEPHCEGCVCFEEWSEISSEKENDIISIDENKGYMQFC